MENVSHLFMFKGKLQTKSPSPPKTWPPSPPRNTILNAIDKNWAVGGGELGGLLPKPANLLILLL